MIQSNNDKADLSDKSLQLQSYTLSRCLPSCVVERVSESLRSSSTISRLEWQVIRSQPTDMQKAMHLLQIVIRKGRNACQLFYSSLEMCGPSIFERVTGMPAQLPLDDTPASERGDSAPTYVINIQNSTLYNCVIGHGNYQSVVGEQLPLMTQDPEQDKHGGCSCSCGHQAEVQTATPEPALLQVHTSSLQYVTIGDHNTMQVNHAPCGAEEDDAELQDRHTN